ncbi:MAG: glycosyltransferase family 4 protein [Actinobacteria bacterium]|nr:glycosyltransferase family 4 protein [Actinomycetota bacterium]
MAAQKRPPDEPTDDLPGGSLDALIGASGIRRIHVLAWRDLDDPEAGGSEIHAHEVARRWSDAGLEVTVRTSHAAGHRSSIRRDGYRVVRRAGRYMVFPRAVAAEILRAHGRRDALVEIWNGVPFFSPLWAANPRMTILHHHHELLWPMALSPGLARLGSFLERRIAPPCYRNTPVVTLSRSSRASLVTDLRLPGHGVHVVEPGIDGRFTPGGDRSTAPLVVAAGRLMPSKRFDALIRTIAEVRRTVPATSLEIIGQGYAKEDLSAVVAELGAESWVDLRGQVDDDDLVSAYRRAWVVASASASEGWGMTLTEAAACGTPAVATRIPGHEDAVEHDVSGLLADDDPQLAGHLAALLADGDRRTTFGAAALARSARYNWDRTATEAFRVLASTVPPGR